MISRTGSAVTYTVSIALLVRSVRVSALIRVSLRGCNELKGTRKRELSLL